MTRRIHIALLALPLLAGCIVAGGGSHAPESDAETARRSWNRLDWSDYDMRIHRSCFCIGAGAYDVFVRHDSVVAAYAADEIASPVPVAWWHDVFPTVDELIDMAERAGREAAVVDVEFAEGGWPTKLDIDWLADAVDDEVYYAVESVEQAPENEVVDLAFGATADLMGLSIRFDEVESDSRCALDVQCIWAGEAKVRLNVTRRDGTSVEVRLTDNPAVESAEVLTVIDGIRLRLLVVMPYPEHAAERIPPSSYTVRLLAERA